MAQIIQLVIALMLLQHHSHGLPLQRYHGRPGGHRRHMRPTLPSPPPPATPSPAPSRCNRTIAPEGLPKLSEEMRSDCDEPPRNGRCICTCPRTPLPGASGSGFPLVPGFPRLPRGGVGGSTPSSSLMECVTPLAALMTCGSFLTGSEPETSTSQSECCSGLGGFLKMKWLSDNKILE